MNTNPAETLGNLGKVYRMPESIAEEPDTVRSAWALGLFSGIVGDDDTEVKIISVENKEKTYERLEIHDLSPQMYAVLKGTVAIPLALELDHKAVRFYKVSEGDSIVLQARVWHGGAVGIDVPAEVLVVLKKGTSESDTKKLPVWPPVEFCL